MEQLCGQDESQLLTLADGHRLLAAVAADFASMQQAAAQAGLNLALASSYRSFARQLTIWNDKWCGRRPVLDLAERPIDMASLSDKGKCFAILTFSALPGASRHHWGTDMDVYDKSAIDACGQQLQLVASEYDPGGPCHALAQWLHLHAGQFGFYRPYAAYRGGVAAEPWHLSHKQQADTMALALTPELLAAVLENVDIAGKAVILANLDEIHARFILNQGVTA